MKFSKQEKEDLFKAWFALSIAFAILINEGFSLLLAPAPTYVSPPPLLPSPTRGYACHY